MIIANKVGFWKVNFGHVLNPLRKHFYDKHCIIVGEKAEKKELESLRQLKWEEAERQKQDSVIQRSTVPRLTTRKNATSLKFYLFTFIFAVVQNGFQAVPTFSFDKKKLR